MSHFARDLGASLVAALVLSRVSQRAVSEPILQLADTARIVSRKKITQSALPSTGDHDEVALLVDAFNGMLVEIQKRDSALQESERQFRNLADSIPQIAWMAEASGATLLVQPPLVRIHGDHSGADGGLGLEIRT